MHKIIIGIDPDSKAHGVAIYCDGKLIELDTMVIIDFIKKFDTWRSTDITVHIEDVCDNNAVFRTGNNKNVQQSIARRLGMVQQSQVELERILAHYKIKVVKHKISKMWKKDKAQFEKVTGWTGRSNEDTRSAAYFGWLGTNKS